MDQERSSILSTMAAGLGAILFAISIDNRELNGTEIRGPITALANGVDSASDEPQPVMATTNKTSKEKRRKKRRPASQVVSFDDEDGEVTPEWLVLLVRKPLN